MRIALGLAIALLSTAPAAAAEAKRTPDPAPSARALELSRRLVALNSTAETRDMASLLLAPMVTAMAAKKGLLTASEQKDFGKAVNAAMPAAFDAKRARMAEAYAGIYTETELEALIAFYDSDVGRSIASKQVQVGMVNGLSGAGVMMDVMAEAKRTFCPAHPKARLCVQKQDQPAAS